MPFIAPPPIDSKRSFQLSIASVEHWKCRLAIILTVEEPTYRERSNLHILLMIERIWLSYQLPSRRSAMTKSRTSVIDQHVQSRAPLDKFHSHRSNISHVQFQLPMPSLPPVTTATRSFWDAVFLRPKPLLLMSPLILSHKT